MFPLKLQCQALIHVVSTDQEMDYDTIYHGFQHQSLTSSQTWHALRIGSRIQMITAYYLEQLDVSDQLFNQLIWLHKLYSRHTCNRKANPHLVL